MILDEYLDYLHESKWKRLLASGKLAKKDLMKIKKAGLPKSQRKWTAGVDKGTENILKKKGIRSTNRYHNQMAKNKGVKPGTRLKGSTGVLSSHAITNPGKKPSIHTPSGIRKKRQTFRAITKRHEADELTRKTRMATRKGKKNPLEPSLKGTSTAHSSPEVLRRERELTRTSHKLYGKKGGSAILPHIRKKITGEYKDIPSKKVIKKMEKKISKAPAKDLKKMRDDMAKLKPEERRKAMKKYIKSGEGSRSGRKKWTKIILRKQ